MKYMLLIYGDENVLDQTERERCYGESAALAHQIKASGHYVAASPLQSISQAMSVRVREGKRLITDGPFAETHEQLGGYYLVDVPSLEDAIGIAERIPGAKWGTVEVRPIVELTNLPEI